MGEAEYGLKAVGTGPFKLRAWDGATRVSVSGLGKMLTKIQKLSGAGFPVPNSLETLHAAGGGVFF